MKKLFLFSGLCICMSLPAQLLFHNIYPIGDDSNIGAKLRYVDKEPILFEANPVARFSFINTIHNNMEEHGKIFGGCFYVNVKSALRMYQANSQPVRTPSYRVLLGTQGIFKVFSNGYMAMMYESGHYSNGQTGAAFSDRFPDGSRQSDSIYQTITDTTSLARILNRGSGNYSTNYTELIWNYRTGRYVHENLHWQISVKAGFNVYHKLLWYCLPFGGYTDNDIKLYGKYRMLGGVEYIHVFKPGNEDVGVRLSVATNIEYIEKPHKSVNPLRMENTLTFFPVRKYPEFGIFVMYVYGHDNYNFRFVDSGHSVYAGACWTPFIPFKNARPWGSSS